MEPLEDGDDDEDEGDGAEDDEDAGDKVYGAHPWHRYTYHPSHRHPSSSSCEHAGKCCEPSLCTIRRPAAV